MVTVREPPKSRMGAKIKVMMSIRRILLGFGCCDIRPN
jgi:hypothetical protein